ncbi:MAG: FAD-dependent oxidoreductase, partial [Pyrinomonadaceae bacterium]|nr:FAD-dependent oxidoreductase [Pyrinomonadaceae bacterium]
MFVAGTVIIGGGVVGASVAYHLAERGATDVLVLEREDVQGRGSTGAATGGVRSQFETEVNIWMSMYSIDFFRNWDYETGYEPRGYLFFATTDEQFDYLKRNVETQRDLGVQGVEIVDAGSIRKMIPGMNCDDIRGGSFGATDGFIDPLAVMRSFTEGAVKRGVRLETGTAAMSIVTEGGRVAGVETSDGRIDCKNVVVCSGAWAKLLAATAGISLPVEPLRRQIV